MNLIIESSIKSGRLVWTFPVYHQVWADLGIIYKTPKHGNKVKTGRVYVPPPSSTTVPDSALTSSILRWLVSLVKKVA
jgi:hypothetical protein